MRKLSRSNRERGSALLIIFVMAAFIAIMLYMEMPVAVFEAQRNKEQLLIDRGNEYARAAKLYFRKVGQYPPTIDAMENTNRLRFLRKRYKDPFTGKDDWRQLHAAPNGMLTDSKVKPISNNIAGIGNSNPNANSQNAGNSPFGGTNSAFSSFNASHTSSSSGFGGFSASSSSSNTSNTGEVVVPALPQRRPAVAANPDASSTAGQEAAATTDNGSFNLGSLPPSTPASGNTDPNAQTNAPVGPNGRITGSNGVDPNNSQQTNPGVAANQNSPGTNTQGVSPFRPTPTNSGFNSSSRLGMMQGGGGLGIAGVASKAKGHSIKIVNDQEDYSLWEFYYDPTKDRMQAAAGALPQNNNGPPGRSGSSLNPGNDPFSNNNFGGGANTTQNSFGNSFNRQGNTNSSFGSFGSFGTSNSSAFGSSSSTASGNASPNPPQQ